MQTAVLMFICTLLLGVVHFGFTGFISQQIDDHVYQRIKQYAAQQHTHISALLDARFDLLKSFSSLLISESPADIDQTFTRFCGSIAAVSDFDYLLYIDTQGNYRIDNGCSGSQSAEAGRIATNALAQRITVAQRAFYDGNEPCVLLNVPVKNGYGETLGVLCASYRAQYFGRQLLQESYRDNSFSLLTDAQGNLLFSASPDGLFTPSATSSKDKRTVPSPTFFDEKASAAMLDSMARREDALYTLSHDGIDYALVQTPLSHNDWILFCMIPTAIIADDYAFITRLQFLQMTLTVAIIASCACILISMLLRDKRQLTRENSILSIRAQTDSMTGLFNHATTRSMIASLLDTQPENALLLLLDLDNLKEINDTHGHPIGDHAILIFASLLRRTFPHTEIIGRIGGDEFMVCQREASDRAQAEAQLCALRDSMHREFSGIAKLPEGVTLYCSIGAAYYAPGDDYDSLYRRADEALYQVKRNGKDGYHFG